MKRFVPAIIILGLVALVWFLVTRRSANQSNSGAPSASFQVGKTESHNNISSSSTSSSSDNSTFDARRVLFFESTSSHPLIKRVEALVTRGLKDSSPIETLEVASKTFTEGLKAPNLFLRIDLPEIKEEGVLSRSLKATVTASLGNAPWQSHNYYQGRSTPPLVQFTWNATLDHDSTFSGVRSDSYKEAAVSIAEKLLEGMTNQLKKLSEDRPLLPELPDQFYGPYHPVSDFPFLKNIKARRVASYYGLFTHNETFWRFQTVTNPGSELQGITDEFKSTSWKVDTSSLTNTLDYYVRFAQNDSELEIFRERTERIDATGAETNVVDFIVHYRQVFTDSEREAALEKLFTSNSPLETLLPFQNSFSSKQRERYYAILEKSPASSPRGYLQLAEVYLQRKDTNAALKMLFRTKALRATLDASDIDSQIDELAKKISPKEKLKLEVTPEMYRELGFLEVTNMPQTFEVERALGQPVLMFMVGERGVETMALTIGLPKKGSYPWSMIETKGGSRSWSRSDFNLPASGDWQQTFTFDQRLLKFTAHPLPESKRIKYKIEVLMQR